MTNQKLQPLLQYFLNKWQLTNPTPFIQSKFTDNYVVLYYSSLYQCNVVLKICPSMDITNEQKALTYFNGNGAVKLLDYDIDNKGLLLEYIKPGIALKSLFPKDEMQAIEIAATVIKKLHANPNQMPLNNFQTIDRWLGLLKTHKSNKISDFLIKKASELSDALLQTQKKLYLLHGDLHHENILQKNNEWIAIDPFGVVGELEYEVGAFIRNPVPELLNQKNSTEIIVFRIDQFSKIFGFEKQRLIDWSFVQSVLVACWSEWDYYIKFAEIVHQL